MNNNDTQYWKLLEERYFAGTATDEEERLLLRFAATTRDPAFRQLQAVLGFVCAERRQAQAAPKKPASKFLRPTPKFYWRAAAAVVLIALGTTTALRTIDSMQRNMTADESLVAYVGGKRITDKEQVISLMDSTMQAMGTGTDIADQQLQDMLETLN